MTMVAMLNGDGTFVGFVKASCGVCLVNIYLLSNLAFDGDKKWENGDWIVKFWNGAFGDFQQGFKGVMVEL
jgi:hypothetical protein